MRAGQDRGPPGGRHGFHDNRSVSPNPLQPLVFREDDIGRRLRLRLPHAGGEAPVPAIAAQHARDEIVPRRQPVRRRGHARRTGIEAREGGWRSRRMNTRVGQEQRALSPDRDPPSSAIPCERAVLVRGRVTTVFRLQDREQTRAIRSERT